MRYPILNNLRVTLLHTSQRMLHASPPRPAFVCTPWPSVRGVSRAAPAMTTRLPAGAQFSGTRAESRSLELFREGVPALSPAAHKGQAGRIAVVGGSAHYTGAPYFAAAAALRAGADLAYVWCAPEAAQAIKAYSPDLIVHPGFADAPGAPGSAHGVVLGPGLGRDPALFDVVRKVVAFAVSEGVPLVIDADGLWFLSSDEAVRATIRDAREGSVVYVTPNVVEMKRLQKAVGVETGADLARSFNGRVIVVEKGPEDRVFSLGDSVHVFKPGARKRAGGQGDVLAGMIGVFAAWMHRRASELREEAGVTVLDVAEQYYVAAAVAACTTTRNASRIAFEKHGRSMLASDMLPCIDRAFQEVCGEDDRGKVE